MGVTNVTSNAWETRPSAIDRRRAAKRPSLRSIAIAACLALVFANSASAADYFLGNMKADRILFLGNSITLHPPKADINWNHNWGMAASTQDNDFVHLLASRISQETGGVLRLDPTDPTITNPDGSAVHGDANIINICGPIEWGYATYDNSIFQQQIADQPDIVVLGFGENVNMSTFDGDKLRETVESLVTALKNGSNPNIFMTSCILGANEQIDDIKRQICAEDPERRVFVDLSGFRLDAANLASAESYYPDSPFVLGHPGDAGMQFIADRLFDAMQAHSVPEPASMALVVMAGLCACVRSSFLRMFR